MFTVDKIEARNPEEFYRQLNTYLIGLIEDEVDWLASLSNAAAFVVFAD